MTKDKTKPKKSNIRRMPLTKRLDANLGYLCNNDCLFCYFRDRKGHLSNPHTLEIKGLLSFIKNLGITTVEMTGGEPTIRPDILDLVSYAKNDLEFEKISIITNGSRFCDKAFASEAIARGIDDVLVSVHGHKAELHDKLTGRKGAFAEVLNAIENVVELGASCRTNTVVNKLNYEKASDIAGLVYALGVQKMNYIYFSPLDDAGNAEDYLWVEYSETASSMRDMIDRFNDKLETISIKVIPFCFLKGYENYITNLFQNVYDPYEWDYYHRVHMRRNWIISNIAAIGGMLFLINPKRLLGIGFQKGLREGILRVEAFRRCVKPNVCEECKFDLICPGIWKEYANRFSLDQVRPVKGRKIAEVDYYLHKRFANYYQCQ